jgi:hypothetical protein
MIVAQIDVTRSPKFAERKKTRAGRRHSALLLLMVLSALDILADGEPRRST